MPLRRPCLVASLGLVAFVTALTSASGLPPHDLTVRTDRASMTATALTTRPPAPSVGAAADGAVLLDRYLAVTRFASIMALAEATSAARPPAPLPKAAAIASAPSIGPRNSAGGPCGGIDYPPCYVAQRESGNTYGAINSTGCGGAGCFGRWQASAAWACHFGLPCDIAHWTPEQQDYFARALWDRGRGASNWGLSR